MAKMTIDDLTCVNVTQNALLEFIELIACADCCDIKVSKGDRGWYVTYRPMFTRDIKEDGALVIKEAEADCNDNIGRCRCGYGDVCNV